MSYNGQKIQRILIIVLFLAVPLALLLLMTYYPAFKLLQYSFTNWDGINKKFDYIGFDNYKKIFSQPEIFGIFSKNAAYFLMAVMQNITALLFAIILNSKIKGRTAFRSLIFMPYIMNAIAASYLFAFMYDFEKGPINIFLTAIGIPAVRWLSNPYIVNFSLAGVGFWRFMGFSMIIYLGALQSINADLYECAGLDGANAWNKFLHITLPSVKRIIELNMLLSITGALNAFTEAFSVTKGGPNGASTTFVMKTVETAFEFSDFGLASAMGITLMILVSIVIIVQKKFFSEEGGAI